MHSLPVYLAQVDEWAILENNSALGAILVGHCQKNSTIVVHDPRYWRVLATLTDGMEFGDSIVQSQQACTICGSNSVVGNLIGAAQHGIQYELDSLRRLGRAIVVHDNGKIRVLGPAHY
jgi:ABC-type enterobactin transport system permease subunit